MAAAMADGQSGDNCAGSPCEELDPDVQFGSSGDTGIKFYIGEDKEAEDSLVTDSEEDVHNELEVESLQFQYGVTPPRNVRRIKEKSKSCKKSKERIVVFAKSHSARDFGFVAGFDRTETDIQRKKNRANSTQIANERAFQRKVKRESWGECSTSPSQSMNGGTGSRLEIPSIMIESTNRYRCLNYDLSQSYPAARPVRSATDPMNSLCSHAGGKLLLNSGCPEPRAQFFRTFTKLVEMCVHSKQKENPSLAQLERQTSEENKRWEVELRQALWLELQAWHAGRTMQEQDNYLVQARKGADDVLDEVINFKFEMPNIEGIGGLNVENVKSDTESEKKSKGNVVSNGGKAGGCVASSGCDHTGTSTEDAEESVGIDMELSQNQICARCQKNRTNKSCTGQHGNLYSEVNSRLVVKDDGNVNDDSFKNYDSHDCLTSDGDSCHYPSDEKVGSVGVEGTNSFDNVACKAELNLDRSDRNTQYPGQTETNSRVSVSDQQKQSKCNMKSSIEIQVACQQVINLFERLETVEQLYPTSQALGEENCKYLSEKFQLNFETLCVWLNITKDLNHKLHTVAKILCIDVTDNETSKDWIDIGLEVLGRDVCPLLSKRDDSSGECISRKDSNGGVWPVDGNDMGTPHPVVGRSGSTMSQHTYSSTSRYRSFVNKSLKKMGLIKLGKRIRDILDCSLLQANQALRTQCMQTEDVTEQMMRKRATSVHELEQLLNRQESNSLTRPRSSSRECQKQAFLAIEGFEEDFQELGLPSFCSLYLFLARVPLDITHECLRVRLEHRPKEEPSALSVQQLLRECKEVILGAVLVKDYYLSLVEGIVDDKEMLENDVDEFEHDLQIMFKVYFDYLHNVLHLLQRMPEASKRLKNVLEEEWNFVKERCQHVRGGEAEGGTRFCVMAAGLLDSTGHFLESGLDQCCSDLHSEAEHGEDQRRKVLETCRGIKHLFNEARERASKAVGFQKKLMNDLETASSYHIEVSAAELLAQLEVTGHIQVLARHTAGLMMFVPKHLSCDKGHIVNLLNVCCGVEEADDTVKCNGYLLLVAVDSIECGTDTPVWEGERVTVNPTVETAIGLADIQVGGLILVVSNSLHLEKQCELFQSGMKRAVQVVKKRTSKHQAIAETLDELQNACLSLREGIVSAIERVDENLDVDSMIDMEESERIMLHQNYIETMHACYNFGFEYHKELHRIVTGDSHDKLARDLLTFARKWMTFVITKCDIGMGFRPRWVHQGLEFLTLACDPNTVLSVLPEAEYQDLMKQMNDCIGHMKIGNAASALPSPGPRPQSPAVGKSPSGLLRPGSWPATGKVTKPDKETEAPTRQLSEPANPSSLFEAITCDALEQDGAWPSGGSGSNALLSPAKEGPRLRSNSFVAPPGHSRLDSIRHALRKLETNRNQRLFNKRVIGQVSTRHRDIASELANISNRRVPFKWQRGNKIGEGRFGKVYACVNLDSGELMAMKQIKFHPNDHGEIRDLADEIKNFEGIHHESLVSYYGVELHRDEMFIFMEYCADGTIQDVASLGLPEDMIRVYTAQILEAVSVLHEHGIVHRDVKGANIFLSSGGSLIKLGDFGSSIKLKDPMHTMHGEISNIRGTVAYMAPEMITMDKGAGYGRAADVWSLGCVVVEMATGKPPWPECDNNFAVMFKVGEGETPAIPETLSEEGKAFLQLCFTFDPRDRPSSNELQDHPFVKCC